ncbi:MAG: DM13 domain-containing protein [Chloroflexi bacterium]|nr:DM13 domain-containing protein [Chloroflexota bacterium]
MAMNTVLPPDRAESLRRLLLIIAGLVGLATAAFLLSSQPTIDFLREGPARLLPFKGDEARLVLGIGAGIAAIVAVAALWRGVTIGSLIIAAIALGGGFSLVHVVFTPTLGLVVVAVVADLAGSIERERLAELGPRQYPARWAAGAVVGVVGLVVFAAISWWLASPLFDEGERVEEGLGFAVAGMPATATPTQAPAAATASDATATPAAAPATAEAAQASGTGELIAMGALEGSDSFHTASGQVLLVRSPDGDLILRFQDFEVRNGPDLFIYLTPDPDGDVHVDGAINLSEIKATSGSVNYDVPLDVDAESFRSAVVYCRAFSVIFATAQFE